MTDTNDKLRGLFLSALMVLSVFAGTIALSGAAAASHANWSLSDADDALVDGMTAFQGQTLFNGTHSTSHQVFEVRENSSGTWETQVEADAEGDILIDTSQLSPGKYDVEDSSNTVVATFEVVEQGMSGSFGADSVVNGGSSTTAALSYSSGRANYEVNITATRDGTAVSGSTLDNIFANETRGSQSGNGYVVDSGDASLTTNFSGDAAGNYTFDVQVTDTTASVSDTITVESIGSGGVEMVEGAVQQQVGDNALVTLSFEGSSVGGTANVTIGTSDVNYVHVVEVTDSNADGQAVLTWDTDKAARGKMFNQTGPSQDVFAAAGGDSVVTANLTTNNISNSSRLGATEYDVSVVDQSSGVETDVGIVSLQPASSVERSLTLYTSSDGTLASSTQSSTVAQGDWIIAEVETSSIWGSFNNASMPGPGVSLSVTETDASTGINSNPAQVDLSKGMMTPDGVNNTYYVAFQANTTNLEDGTEFDVTFTIDSSNPYVSDTVTMTKTFHTAARSATINAPASGRLMVPQDQNATISGTSTAAPGTTHTVTWKSSKDLEQTTVEVGEDGTWEATFDMSQVPTGTNFTVTVSDGGLASSVKQNAQIGTPATADVSLSAPDTVTVGDTITATATVSNTGDAAGTFDVSVTVDGEEVRSTTVSLAAGGSTDVSVDVPAESVGAVNFAVSAGDASASAKTIAEAQQTTTAPPTTTSPPPTTTSPPPTTTSPPPTTTSPPPTTTTSDDGSGDGGQPGFGIGVAIVALLGAALLALRRQN